MDYFLIICFQFVGFCLFQFPALKVIDMRSNNDSFNDVLKAFWNEDRVTIFGSCIILFFQEVTHLTIWYYDMPIQNQSIHFWGYSISYVAATFGSAMLLGFMGQALLYGLLGKAGEYIKSKFGTK